MKRSCSGLDIEDQQVIAGHVRVESAQARGFHPAAWADAQKRYVVAPADGLDVWAAHRVLCCVCGRDYAIRQRAFQERHMRKHQEAGEAARPPEFGFWPLTHLFDAITNLCIPLGEQLLHRQVAHHKAAVQQERDRWLAEYVKRKSNPEPERMT